MRIDRRYELRVHLPGTVNPTDGTVDFVLTDFDGELPSAGGQVVDPARGTAASSARRYTFADVDNSVTAHLADPASGRTWLLGRIMEERQGPAGGPMARVYVGRCSGLNNTEGRWSIDVTDERWQERRANLFSQVGDGVQLWPPGPRYRFRNFPVTAEKATVRVLETASSNRVRVSMRAYWVFSRDVVEWIEGDVVEEPSTRREDGLGNFNHLRLDVEGVGRFEVIQFGGLDGTSITEQLTSADSRAGFQVEFWLVDPAGDLGAVDTIHGGASFIAPTAPPSPTLPLLLGVVNPIGLGVPHNEHGVPELADGSPANGWHLLEAWYTRAGVRMDATVWAALKAGDFPPLTEILEEEPSEDLAEFTDAKWYHAVGYAAFTNHQGEISPRKVWLPDAGEFDPNTAFRFDASNLLELPTYDQDAEGVINAVRFRWKRISLLWYRNISGDYGDVLGTPAAPAVANGSASRMTVEVIEPEPELGDTADQLGARDVLVDLSAFPPEGEGRDTGGGVVNSNPSTGMALESARRRVKRELLERWQDGPIVWRFLSYEEAADAQNRTPSDQEPGDLVILDIATIPNPALNLKGGPRLVQLVGKRPGADGIRWEAVDAGPALQPLPTPSVAIAQVPGNGRHAVRLTVSGVPAGATATVELALGAAAPFTVVHDGKLAGTFDVGALPSGTTIRARVKATAPNRIRSVYSAEVSIATTALAAPTVGAATVSGWSGTVGVTNNEPGYPLMPVLRAGGGGTFTDALRTPLSPATTVYTFHTAGGTWDLGFRVVDQFGGSSPVASTFFNAEANPRLLDTPTRIQITQGRPSTGDLDLPPRELWTGVGVEVSWRPEELHAEHVAQMSADGFATIETEVVAAPGQTRVQLHTRDEALDEVARQVRLFARATGFGASPFSAIVEAPGPTALLGNNPPDQFAGGFAEITERSDGKLGAIVDRGGDESTERCYFSVVKNPAGGEDAFPMVDEGSSFLSITAEPPAAGLLPLFGQFPPGAPMDIADGDTILATFRFWNRRTKWGQTVYRKLRVGAPDGLLVDVLSSSWRKLSTSTVRPFLVGTHDFSATLLWGKGVNSVRVELEVDLLGAPTWVVRNSDDPEAMLEWLEIVPKTPIPRIRLTGFSGAGQTGSFFSRTLALLHPDNANGGLIATDHDGGSIPGHKILIAANAAFTVAEDAAGPFANTSAVKFIDRPEYDAGVLSAAWTPDGNNGPRQSATMNPGAALTINAPLNFGGYQDLAVDTNGGTISFAGLSGQTDPITGGGRYLIQLRRAFGAIYVAGVADLT